MANTTLGYLLFFAGIAIIIFSAVSMYLVYSDSQPPVQLFDLPPFILDSKTITMLGFKNVPENAAIELLPASINNQFANLIAHFVLMGFLGGVGFRLASIGTNLIRPIYIQVRELPREVTAS